MKTAIRAVVALAALALALPGGAQIFKWTDSSGKVHYGDAPPDDVKKQELKVSAQSFGGPPQVDNWAAVIRGEKRASGMLATAGLTMFSAQWCGYCKQAKAYLAKRGIPYRDVDIDASDSNKREWQQFGGKGVPLFIAGDKRMRGFGAEALGRFIADTQR